MLEPTRTQSMGLTTDVSVRTWLRADDLEESALLRLQMPTRIR